MNGGRGKRKTVSTNDMGDLLDRFFGKGTPRLGGPAVANPRDSRKDAAE